MNKILVSLVAIGVAAAIGIGGTIAYFTAQTTSGENTFTAGTMKMDVLSQNTDAALDFDLTNWAPGDKTLVNFDVKNTGTLPMNIRGFANGAWYDGETVITPAPTTGGAYVSKIEYWDGVAWKEMDRASSGLKGEFYYSPDGTDSGNFTVAPGGRAQIQLTVKFDKSSGNEYQGKIFKATITTQAKQTNASWDGWTWPL